MSPQRGGGGGGRARRVYGHAGYGLHPDEVEPDLVKRVTDRLGALFGDGKYFPLTVKGWENLTESPSLLVSNHSGGTTVLDLWGLGVAWYQHFQDSRALHALAHDIIFSVEGVARAFGRLGVLRAHPQIGERVLREWRRDLIVCPGGDRDVWRPYRDRYRVHFSGRKGYARLALRAGVPIVPVAHAGAHETLVVLTDGARLARSLRLPELFRAEIFPIHLSFPWGLGVGPFPHLPPPTHLRYRFGPPIFPPAGWTGGEDPPEDMVLAHDEAVRAALQQQLDQLLEEAEPFQQRAARLGREMRRKFRLRRGE